MNKHRKECKNLKVQTRQKAMNYFKKWKLLVKPHENENPEKAEDFNDKTE